VDDPTSPSGLPGAQSEIEAVAALFPNHRTYLGAAARESVVKRDPDVASAAILHFATHATVDLSNPGYSSLLLAPDPLTGDDGLLQVHEILDLKLHRPAQAVCKRLIVINNKQRIIGR
jgi:CHAT domain-containing protein